LRDTVGSTATTRRHDMRNAVIGLNGNWQDALGADAGGRNGLAVNVTTGRLTLDADSAAQDAASAQSAGNFVKLGYQAERLQALGAGWALALNLSGQLADRNLASAERFSLGGSQGVRAYPQGEGSGDAGWLASVELRWQVAPGWQLQAFGDAGAVKINQKPWADVDNRRRLAGVGLGVSWGVDKTSFTLVAAQATDRELVRPGPQVWAQASMGF
jgi:hemolysin activation/secretion protein